MNSKIKDNELKKDLDIVKTFGQSCNLVIPKSVARRYGINFPGHVILEFRKEGILIRKLEV